MSTVVALLEAAIWFYTIILIFRVIMEIVLSYALDYTPHGVMLVVVEASFTATDPPLKLLRRLIPPLTLGRVALDLSVLVLFILLQVLSILIRLIPVS